MEKLKIKRRCQHQPTLCVAPHILWAIMRTQAAFMSGWHTPIMVQSDCDPLRCLAATNLDPEPMVCPFPAWTLLAVYQVPGIDFDPRSPYTENPSISRSTNHANPLPSSGCCRIFVRVNGPGYRKLEASQSQNTCRAGRAGPWRASARTSPWATSE